MARYIVRASVTVDVEMSIEADSGLDAEKIFNDKISMTANLVDVEESKFDVDEESITNVEAFEVFEE